MIFYFKLIEPNIVKRDFLRFFLPRRRKDAKCSVSIFLPVKYQDRILNFVLRILVYEGVAYGAFVIPSLPEESSVREEE
jgi:hypothetical protein